MTRDDIEILKVLIDHAQSVAASDDSDGEAGAQVIFNARNEEGKSPVDYMNEFMGLFATNNAEVIEQLLRIKLNWLKLELDNGWTLLRHCVKEGLLTSFIVRALAHQLFRIKAADYIEILLNTHIEDLTLITSSGWTLLHHCAKEGIVTKTILRALQHQVNSMDSSKKTPIFHAKDLETVFMFLKEDLRGLKLELDDGTNIIQYCVDEGLVTSRYLSTSCEEDNYQQVKLLLKIPGIIDHETHDGLTGFVISLVKQNRDIIMAFLHSGIGSHDRNVFLASEFCRLPSVANKDLQRLIQQFLSTTQTERDGNICTVEKEKDAM